MQATNRLGEAEPLMRRALAIDEASYGPDHPNVAIRLNNLASLLQDTNRLGEAEPLSRRHLEIFLWFTLRPATNIPTSVRRSKLHRAAGRRRDRARRRSRRGWRRSAIRSGFGRVPGRPPKMHRAPDNRPPERRGLFLCTLSGLDRAAPLSGQARASALSASRRFVPSEIRQVRRLPVEGLAWLLE